jgi:hypothetical protein
MRQRPISRRTTFGAPETYTRSGGVLAFDVNLHAAAIVRVDSVVQLGWEAQER